MTPFAVRLRADMERARVTCAELADGIGVSVHTVRAWRVGRRVPCCRHCVAAVWAFLEVAGRSRAVDRTG